MSESKTILNIEKPQTQSVKAVCALLAWKGRSSNPLPQFVELGSGDSRLVPRCVRAKLTWSVSSAPQQ